MFFADKIKEIPKNYKVLEVGPGGHPHPRSDIFLEKIFDDEHEASAQRGYANKAAIKKKIVYYEGGTFPFEDNEFDYVICSHVLEHVPAEDLKVFISEMQRVGKAGFIEYPNAFYEFINYQPVHLWLMNYRNDTILFLDKNIFESNYIHKIFREMFYGNDKYLFEIFGRYRELFFTHFEWSGNINYEIVNSYDELVNEEDFKKYQNYFLKFKKGKHSRKPLLYPLKHFIYKNLIKLKAK